MNPLRRDFYAQIDMEWAAASRGSPRLLVMAGEAGSGKSWLLEHWRSQLPILNGRQVWILRRGSWLSELLEWGETWFREVRDASFLSAARQLAPHLKWPALADKGREPHSSAQVVLSIYTAVQQLAWRLGGLGLIVEDVHLWSREEQETLTLFWRRVVSTSPPLLMILTCHPEQATEWLTSLKQEATLYRKDQNESLITLNVRPINVLETTELCGSVLRGATPPGDLAEWLYPRAQGNILHTLQLLRYLLDSGALRQARPIWIFRPPASELGLPDSLSEALYANLVPIQDDPVAWSLVAGLAVMPLGADAEQLAGLLEWSDERVAEETSSGVTRGHLKIFIDGRRRRFALSHPLLPALIRSMLGGPQRRALHARAAEQTDDPDERARQARLGDHPRSAEWTRQALLAAQARFDWANVESHARALLRPAIVDAAQEALRVMLARALRAQGREQEADMYLEGLTSEDALILRATVLRALAQPEEAFAILETCTFTGSSYEVALLRAGLLTDRRDFVQASEQLGRLLNGALNALQRAVVFGELGRIQFLQAQYTAALQFNVEAASILDEQHDSELLSQCLNRVGMLSIQVGRWAEAEPALRRSIALQEGIASFAAISARYNNLGLLLLHLGRYPEAHDHLVRALRLAEASGERGTQADVLHNLSLVMFYQGDADGSNAALERCIESRTQVGLTSSASDARFYLADKLAIQGHPQQGLELIARNDLPWDSTTGVANILMCSGRTLEAWTWLEQKRNPECDVTAITAVLAVSRALCALRLGRPEALHEAQRAVEECQHFPNPYRRAEAQLILALNGERADETNARTMVQTTLQTLLGAPGHLLLHQRVVPDLIARLTAQTPPTLPTAENERAARPTFIRTFGAFGLEGAGQLIPWRARKVRALLALLLSAHLDNRGPGIHREELKTELWPDTEEATAEGNLRITLSRLRSALGETGQIVNRLGSLMLEGINADVTVFLRAIHNADLETAVQVYQGEFLPRIDLPRVNDLRAQLRARWRGAALELAGKRSSEEAATLYRRVIDDDPLDLVSHLTCLKDLHQRGETGLFLHALDHSIHTYRNEVGEIPSEVLAWIQHSAAQ
jgi:tetratricopeptide (TPR) repeat protein